MWGDFLADFLAGGGAGEGDLAALSLFGRGGVFGSTFDIGLFFNAINAATSSTSSSEKIDCSASEFSEEDPPEDPVEEGVLSPEESEWTTKKKRGNVIKFQNNIEHIMHNKPFLK
jgi:hypothetical protein